MRGGSRRRSGAIGLWALTVCAAGWTVLVLAAPLLPGVLSAIVYAVSSVVCHQIPERSFYWGASQFAVCARCTGIYAGASVVAVMAASMGTGRVFHAVAWTRAVAALGAMPTVVQVASEWLNVWQPSHLARFAAGLPLGAAGLAVLAAAVVVTTLHYD